MPSERRKTQPPERSPNLQGSWSRIASPHGTPCLPVWHPRICEPSSQRPEQVTDECWRSIIAFAFRHQTLPLS